MSSGKKSLPQELLQGFKGVKSGSDGLFPVDSNYLNTKYDGINKAQKIMSVFDTIGLIVHEKINSDPSPCLEHCIRSYMANKDVTPKDANYIEYYKILPTHITDLIGDFITSRLHIRSNSKIARMILSMNYKIMRDFMPGVCDSCPVKISCHMSGEYASEGECCEQTSN